MTVLAMTARRSFAWSVARSGAAFGRRGVWVITSAIALASIMVALPETRELVLTALSDAYIQVSTFVAASLAVFFGIERLFHIDAGTVLQRHRKWQVPVAAFLGALPGCGGAIVVVTHYVRGNVGFGAVLAVLTATMGDAAFLLLAQEPATGLAIAALGFAVGTMSGWLVERIHGPDFMRQSASARMPATPADEASTNRLRAFNGLWIVLMVPGLVMGILSAFQIDTDAVFSWTGVPEPTLAIGVAGSILAIAMWAFARPGTPAETCEPGSRLDRVIADTNFVTAWVVLAFLGYELGVALTDIDLKTAFTIWAPAVPLIAILAGLLPGCGPQVLVTALYLGGAVPLSAQIGNAISNDGDALFPALAVAPRAAVVATLYSAVPALIVAYGWWWLFE